MKGTKCEDCGLRGLVRIVRRINLEEKPWLCNECFEKRLEARDRQKAEKE